jgi:hypothetical protein
VTRPSLDIVLMALALLEASFGASDEGEALVALRADLEVLDRETLVRVAAAIAVEASWAAPPPSIRQRLRRRVQQRRVALMVGPL